MARSKRNERRALLLGTDALMDDDLISEKEEETINVRLRKVVESAVDMIRIAQQAFGAARGRRRDLRELPMIEGRATS